MQTHLVNASTNLFFVQLFIPIYDNGNEHWFLVVVQLLNERVEIWDSLSTAVARRSRTDVTKDVVCCCQFNLHANMLSSPIK